MSENKNDMNVSTAEESLQQSYSYVLHGAQAYCNFGSRLARLTLDKCHGTYMHDMPIMTTEDTKVQTNIKAFGFCSSMDNPERLEAVKAVMKKVEDDKNFLDYMMDGISFLANKVESIFGMDESEDKDDKYHGYSKDVYEGVTVVCHPLIEAGCRWSGGTDKLQINGKQALNSGCSLVCARGGGVIQIIEDGQENATLEQHSVTDFSQWHAGDEYPEPTVRNMEALDAHIDELNKQLENCTDAQQRAALEAQIAEKTQLQSDMSTTVDVLADMRTQALIYGFQDEAAYQQYVNNMDTIKSAYKNGTPVIQASVTDTEALINGAYAEVMDGGNATEYVAKESKFEINYDSFEGTAVTEENKGDVPCIYFNGQLMSSNEYNQYITNYVTAAVEANEAAEAAAAENGGFQEASSSHK